LIDNLTDFDDLIFAEIFDPDCAVDAGLVQDIPRSGPPNPKYICQADIRPLVPRQIDSGNTRHLFSLPSNRETLIVIRESHSASRLTVNE
jgi:hypothetical protein